MHSRSEEVDPERITTLVKEARPGRGEDRIAALTLPDRELVLVVDGAGGQAGGAAAAEFLCAAFERLRDEGTPARWSTWLAQLDRELAASDSCGLAAAVALEVGCDGTIAGASAGDCEAWIFGDGEPRNLTAGQVRKPLLGDGAAPIDFAGRLGGGTLVVGTDGLWKYANRQRVAQVCEALDALHSGTVHHDLKPQNVLIADAAMRPSAATVALVDVARMRSGALQDDVAVVLVRGG